MQKAATFAACGPRRPPMDGWGVAILVVGVAALLCAALCFIVYRLTLSANSEPKTEARRESLRAYRPPDDRGA